MRWIMARTGGGTMKRQTSKRTRKPEKTAPRALPQNSPFGPLREILAIAEKCGLLSGPRTHMLRGRVPIGLVQQAKLKSGITSESKPLEAALANLAVTDNYAQWLLAQRGTVKSEFSLEF
jgi:hypothetical protein